MAATLQDLPPHVTNLVLGIVERFQPEKVILFGSHATGTADEESDVDLLVVMDTELSSFKQAAAIYHTLDHRTPVDLFVRTPVQLIHRNRRDLILREILQEGITIYRSPKLRRGSMLRKSTLVWRCGRWSHHARSMKASAITHSSASRST